MKEARPGRSSGLPPGPPPVNAGSSSPHGGLPPGRIPDEKEGSAGPDRRSAVGVVP